MKVGAERKKVILLVGLLAFAVVLYFYNSRSEFEEDSAQAPVPSVSQVQAPGAPRASSNTPAAPALISQAPRIGSSSSRVSSEEFRPSLKKLKAEGAIDPMTLDPTLRLDLLAKLQDVNIEGGGRSLFEFSQPPAPKTPEPKVVPKPLNAAAEEKSEGKNEGKKEAASKPPPPPIPLKFYGYATPVKQGVKRAFFLDGEDIFVASEGEIVKKRYKIVRIGVNSAVVEDTQHGNNQQTLPLVQEVAG